MTSIETGQVLGLTFNRHQDYNKPEGYLLIFPLQGEGLGRFYTVARSCDHDIVRVLEIHPKTVPQTIEIEVCQSF